MTLAVSTAVVLALLPFVFFRGRELARALGIEIAIYAFAGAIAIYAHSLGVQDLDPATALATLFVLQLAVIAIQIGASSQVQNLAMRFAIAAALVYASVLPAQLRAPIDGDEPFYLLLTESMARDHDVDLANQYRDIAHTDLGRPDLVPQFGDPSGPHGEQYSRHEPFLPLLMVPAYLLFGVPGAIAMIALCGVLLARSLVRWMEDEGVSDQTIRIVMPLVLFGPPIIYYAARVWPEVPGALCFVEAVRGMRQRRVQRWLPALFALVMLKLRFGLLGVMLLGTILLRKKPRIAVITIVAMAVPLAVVWWISGSVLNVHTWRELLPSAPKPYLIGLCGLLLDGAAGLLVQAPLFLLGVFALARWRSMPEGFRLGAIASSLYVVTLLPRSEWHGGWSPPLRYIVVLLPVLALGAAKLIELSSSAKEMLAPVAVWTIGITAHALAAPWSLFHIANGENAIGEWLSAMFHSDFSRLFPSFIRLNTAGIAAAVLLIAFFAVVKLRGDAPAFAIAPLIIVGVALFFHYGRTPADRIEFEDAHVIHNGGELYPYQYQVARFQYRGGWILKKGESVSFLAHRGRHQLFYSSAAPATIELGGRVYTLGAAPAYAETFIEVPLEGRTTLNCIEGTINLDRMELAR